MFRSGEAVDFISHWNLLGINELQDSRRTACSPGFALLEQKKKKDVIKIHTQSTKPENRL